MKNALFLFVLFSVSIAYADTLISYEGTYKKNPNSKCGLDLTFDTENKLVEVYAYLYQQGQFAHSATYNNRDDDKYNNGELELKTKGGKIQTLNARATTEIFNGLPSSSLLVKNFDAEDMKADIRVATTNEIGFSWMSKKTCEKMHRAERRF